jgi:hypothetical protein
MLVSWIILIVDPPIRVAIDPPIRVARAFYPD